MSSVIRLLAQEILLHLPSRSCNASVLIGPSLGLPDSYANGLLIYLLLFANSCEILFLCLGLHLPSRSCNAAVLIGPSLGLPDSYANGLFFFLTVILSPIYPALRVKKLTRVFVGLKNFSITSCAIPISTGLHEKISI